MPKSKLEAILWKLYIKGDPRISVLESFQKVPYTYVKVVVNDGKHDIIVQDIAAYPFAYQKYEKNALNAAVQNALEKAADLITESALTVMIAEASDDPV